MGFKRFSECPANISLRLKQARYAWLEAEIEVSEQWVTLQDSVILTNLK